MSDSPASTGDASGAGEAFDLARLQQLVELMEKHGLTDVSLRNGAQQWRLRRGHAVAYSAPVAMAPAPLPAPAPVAGTAAPAAPTAAAPAVDPAEREIKSPTVGTFYTSPTPEEPAFVAVGTRVSADTVVCLIEAMKVFNQITAEVSGTITAILVQNGQPVEFGQPLFRVRA